MVRGQRRGLSSPIAYTGCPGTSFSRHVRIWRSDPLRRRTWRPSALSDWAGTLFSTTVWEVLDYVVDRVFGVGCDRTWRRFSDRAGGYSAISVPLACRGVLRGCADAGSSSPSHWPRTRHAHCTHSTLAMDAAWHNSDRRRSGHLCLRPVVPMAVFKQPFSGVRRKSIASGLRYLDYLQDPSQACVPRIAVQSSFISFLIKSGSSRKSDATDDDSTFGCPSHACDGSDVDGRPNVF